MKTYQGRREGAAVIVTVDGRRLNPRLDLRNHSPTGFEWGYAGSGPAQLSLALLVDHFGDPERALAMYQEFKRAVVAKLPYPGWTLDSAHITEALERLSPMPSIPVDEGHTIPLSQMLSQVSTQPWGLAESSTGNTVRLFGWQGTDPLRQVCIGSLNSPADARYACHATGLFFEVVTALKLMLDNLKGPRSRLSTSQVDFCARALDEALTIQPE